MAKDDKQLVQKAVKRLEDKDKDGARSYLRRALKINPNNEQAWNALAETTDIASERKKYRRFAVNIKNVNDEVRDETRRLGIEPEKFSWWEKIWNKKNIVPSVLGFLIFTLSQTLWLVFTDVIPTMRTVNKMTGEWNIAVAGFSSLDTDLKRADLIVTGSIFSNRLAQEMALLNEEDNLVVQIWDPQQVDQTITGDNAEIRAIEAEKLAGDINADVVIYGTIQKSENGYLLQPEFFIRAENNFEAEELIGQHRFGGPISIQATRDTFPTQVPLNIELARRSEILALVARGLSLYLVHSYDQALELFTQANQADLWQNPEGRETICLFQGNAAIRSHLFEQARLAYTQSIQIEPQYGRGYGGLGNVTYSLALESASNYTFAPDQEGLLQAKIYFEQALQAEIQPPSAEIPSRAAFGIGQIYMVQWFSGQDTRDLAIEQFNVVLTNYGGGENSRLQELASETHARLGVIYRKDGQMDAAIAELQQAVELSTLPARKGLNWASLSDLYDQQGHAEEAQNASRQSIEQYKLAIALPISDDLRAFYWGKIGERYEFLQEKEQAVHAYQQALSLLPTDDVDYLTYQQRLEALQP